MTLTVTIPIISFFLQLVRALAHWLEHVCHTLLYPPPTALLRQQLAILQRQVKRPYLSRWDRFGLLVLASRVCRWKDALLIIQADTLLRRHREGFRLFWR